MKVLVIGGSGSGKSEYAENLAVELSKSREENKGDDRRFYIATMMPYDDEMKKRIEKHQETRKRKDFFTIECFQNIEVVELPSNSTVLLECLSNLTANEMFQEEKREAESVFYKIKTGIQAISRQCRNLVVVSNDLFSSGEIYEEETREYQRLLGRLNQELTGEFDQTVEIVCGIPIINKKDS